MWSVQGFFFEAYEKLDEKFLSVWKKTVENPWSEDDQQKKLRGNGALRCSTAARKSWRREKQIFSFESDSGSGRDDKPWFAADNDIAANDGAKEDKNIW